ncbi:outer membrane beta-barrel family protein [Pontibacter indicus]|uniref:Outer membrane receptor proteins, mostly Fe transport n=1 Tax=Pontibacter indicus TaxID=1317125 RepID=A0A1R3WH55_9BACT|nr:outer membrane beta-barrel family protein [Pontibacter indicus]SIT77238.1 Outer membrane receptor proteins, mostly Fe transport [Pontibacter indicus]
MKKLFYLLALVLLSTLSHNTLAQQEGWLTGQVLDEKGQGLGFVNVAVVSSSTNAVVTGAIAEMEGAFRIKTPVKGSYKLKLSGLGYLPLVTETFEVTGPDFNRDFGKLQLKPDVKTLKEVTIQTMRPTITNDAEKMVVSVEGTGLAQGSTAYEVLEKSPGVWIDQDGNITLNGKPGVQVMINGKQSYLSGKQLQNLLQGMSAENLKDLEIITNPSARYDAEGASGIININLKKNEAYGMNGNVYVGYQYNRMSSFNSGFDLNHKSGRWNTTAGVDFSRRKSFRDMEMERIFNDPEGRSYFDQVGIEERERINPTLRLGTDYEINERHSVGFMSNLFYNANEGIFNTESDLRRPVAADSRHISATNEHESTYRNGTFNLHYNGKLDTVGTTLSADVDYARITDETDFVFKNRQFVLGTNELVSQEHLTSYNPTGYDILAAKVDFGKKLGQDGKLELGAKASHVVSDNELLFYEITDGRQVLDPRRTSHFVYTENIYAGYANYSTKLSDTWKVMAGLRAEHTSSEGNSITLKDITKRNYLDLFPSLFLQQKVSDNYQVSYKYSRRINRPYYSQLNPFIFYLDPYTWSQGYPNLKPQYTNSFEVTQTLKEKYNLMAGYSITTDFIGEIPTYNSEDNTTVFGQRNIESYKNLYTTLVAPVRVSGKWEMNNTATLAYQRYTKEVNAQDVVNDEVLFFVQSNQNIQLPKNVRMELNAGFQGPAVYGLYEIQSQWWLDAGLKRTFLDDRLTLSLNATDIFKTRVLKVKTHLEGNLNAIDQYQGTQSIRINLRYNFAKGKDFETKKRNTNVEEINRTGN